MSLPDQAADKSQKPKADQPPLTSQSLDETNKIKRKISESLDYLIRDLKEQSMEKSGSLSS